MKADKLPACFWKFIRLVRRLSPVIALIVFATGSTEAQTVDEIIAKNIQARGGLEKLKAVKTLQTTVKFSDGSFRAEFRQQNKRADKVREEIIVQGMAQIQAYDGKTGWQISPFQGRKDPDLMSADDMKSLIVDADIDGPLETPTSPSGSGLFKTADGGATWQELDEKDRQGIAREAVGTNCGYHRPFKARCRLHDD